MSTVLRVRDLTKSFTLHTQGGVRLPVLDGVTLTVFSGECVVLADPSGAGKSTLLRVIYGNYLAERGSILLRHRRQSTAMGRRDTASSSCAAPIHAQSSTFAATPSAT